MTLAEKIVRLMKLRGFTDASLAAAVAAMGRKVSYQSIQQLRDHPEREPRAVVEIAAALGFTVESLKRWKPSDPLPSAAVVRDQIGSYGSSHVAGFHIGTMRSAFKLLAYVLDIMGEPPELVNDPAMLHEAYITVSEAGASDDELSENKMVELAPRLAARLRQRG